MASESPQQAPPTARGRRRLFPLAGTLAAANDPEAIVDVRPDSAGSPGAMAAPSADPLTGASEPPRADALGLPEDAARLVRALRTPAVWVDATGSVAWAHPAMEALRVVSRRAIRVPEIAAMVELSRRTDQVVQRDMAVKRPGRRQPKLSLRVRVSPMGRGAVLVIVEDMSEAERLDRVRRDFVANVSHELKTPIGALSLLAEAVVEGRDDPEAVERFASRMVAETRRLTTLVNDLMDLSRLEGIDPLHPMEPVAIDEVVAEACDDVRLMAEEHDIRFLRGGVPGLRVLGVHAQLTGAVRNLLTNAVNYSAPGTKVAVTTGVADGSVTIAVTDQGIGIPAGELDRIFERFYRVDQARSRDTGGTGLGLSIVKHVCANHGGHCDVWSRIGAGSTFTIRLPELTDRDGTGPAGQPGTKRGRKAPAKEEQ